MANKIKLGNRPKTFKPFPVTVQMPDGSEGVIPVVYKYRTKSEFGRWMDEASARVKQESEAAKQSTSVEDGGAAAEFSWEKFYEQNTEVAVDQLLKAIESWELDEPLNREMLLQMGDEAPAAVAALLAAYGNACREGRLGN